MSKKRNSLTALLLMLLILVMGSASADCPPSYTEQDCCNEECSPCGGLPGKVGGSLEFLWWKACINDLDYAISFNGNVAGAPNVVGTYQFVDHNWAPGLRANLFVGSVFCNLDFGFTYTWMHDSKTASVTGTPAGAGVPPSVQSTLLYPGLPPIVIAPATTTSLFFLGFEATHSYRYQTFEGLFSGRFDLNCNSFFTPFFGVIGLKLDQSWKSRTLPALTPVQITALGPYVPFYNMTWYSEFEAAGLKLGADYTYELTCDIDFYTSVAAMVVAGYDHWDFESKAFPTSLTPTGGTPPFFVTDFIYHEKEKHLVCSPGVHLKAGFSSTSTFLGPETAMFIGYEFVSWWNTPTVRPQQFTFREGGGRFALHGLYAGLSVKI